MSKQSAQREIEIGRNMARNLGDALSSAIPEQTGHDRAAERIVRDMQRAPKTHTPEPWIVIADEGKGDHPNHQFRFVGTADYDEGACRGHIVAKLTDAVEIEANANLLAAAPDAIKVCRQLAALCNPIDVGFDVVAHHIPVTVPTSIITAARDAIAKADGK